MSDEAPFDEDMLAAALRAAMDQIAAVLRPLTQAAADAVESFKQAGFSAEAADTMGASYYQTMLAICTKRMLGG